LIWCWLERELYSIYHFHYSAHLLAQDCTENSDIF
jgi:hypothetical protein